MVPKKALEVKNHYLTGGDSLATFLDASSPLCVLLTSNSQEDEANSHSKRAAS